MAKTERDPAADRVAKAEKLLDTAADLYGKLGLVLDEVTVILRGGVGIGTQLKEFEETFDAAWGHRYAHGQTGHYVWQRAKDRAQIKRLIALLGLEEIQARAVRYMATDDPFLSRTRHPFGLFVSGINSYAAVGEVAAFELSAPVDCRHVPPCADDRTHTRRKVAETRAVS